MSLITQGIIWTGATAEREGRRCEYSGRPAPELGAANGGARQSTFETPVRPPRPRPAGPRYKARQRVRGTGDVGHGTAWQGIPGTVRHGMVGHGLVSTSWRGKVWHGWVRHGAARHGTARSLRRRTICDLANFARWRLIGIGGRGKGVLDDEAPLGAPQVPESTL